MFNYDGIKELARTIGRPVKHLLALSFGNDPFYAGAGSRGVAAEWFGGIWRDHAGNTTHLRRIHYRLVSPPEGIRILLPNGREYQNTERDWAFLCEASLSARYLDLVPFDGLVDKRNNEPLLLAKDTDPEQELEAHCGVVERNSLEIPELPPLPELGLGGFKVVQDHIVEIWIEKSTQNDWLVPLCQRRGIGLVVGIGEQSEIRSRELAVRASEYCAPVRVLYLSDFDPGGRSMPKAVARKVEFTSQKLELGDLDFQLIPVALSPEQCRQYNLPRTPIKDTESRKDKFEDTFGVGATELDALEALHPGELSRILEAEINNWLDPDLERRVREVRSEQSLRVVKITKRIHKKYAEQIEELSDRFQQITDELDELKSEIEELYETLDEELEEQAPDLSDIDIPRSNAPGETDRFVLFDSQRDYLTQMDHYNAWKGGNENGECDE
jgi:hypothetical protein